VADGVHASVNPVEGASRSSMVGATSTEAQRAELMQRNDAVLTRGEGRERR
jgi:hypothetical protein